VHGSSWSSAGESPEKRASLGGAHGAPTPHRPMATNLSLTEREVLEAKVLRQLLEHYFRIVQASVIDSVPKAIMLMLVNSLQRDLCVPPPPPRRHAHLHPNP
jgi:hypothetical protein